MFTAVNMCIYNGPFNTVGIGNPVPFGNPATMGYGSGDRFDFGPGNSRGHGGKMMKPRRAYQQYKPFMPSPPPPFPGIRGLGGPMPLLVMAGSTGTRKRKSSTKRKSTKSRTRKRK